MKSLKSIFRMGKMAFFIMVQLAIAISIFNILNNLGSIGVHKTISEFMDYENSRFLIIEEENLIEEVSMGKGMSYGKPNELGLLVNEKKQDIHRELENLKRDGKIENFIIYQYTPQPREFYDSLRKEGLEAKESSGRNLIPYDITAIINQGFLEEVDIKIKSGRTLIKDDFKRDYKKETIPILIGNQLEKIYKVGDKIKREGSSLNDRGDVVNKEEFFFEVVGILEKDSIPISSFIYDNFLETMDLPNSLILIPENNQIEGYSLNVGEDSFGPIIKLNGNISEEKLLLKIKESLLKIDSKLGNLKIRLEPVAGQDEIIKFLYKDTNKIISIGVIIMVLSILGLTTVILGEINKRKREIGIRLAAGATINDIGKELIIEIFLLTLGSTTLSFWFMYLIIGIINLKASFIIGNLILIIIITFAIALIPLLEIRKLKVIELINNSKQN